MLRRHTVVYCSDRLQTPGWLERGGTEHSRCGLVRGRV
jgi:hypothetical protein